MSKNQSALRVHRILFALIPDDTYGFTPIPKFFCYLPKVPIKCLQYSTLKYTLNLNFEFGLRWNRSGLVGLGVLGRSTGYSVTTVLQINGTR